MDGGSSIEVALEATPRRTFAVAVAWPGWSRAGRDEDAALEALLRAGPRYAAALARVGVDLVVPRGRDALIVAHRLPGNAGTEFGAPSVPLPGDEDPLDEVELDRQSRVLQAAWAAFDAAVAGHAGDELAKGPRGGGRDLPRIVDHVLDSDRAYLVQLGARPPKGAGGPGLAAELHAAALATLRARALSLPVENPSRATKPWSARWYVRYVAWHWLDHAWEIEDRAIPRD